MVAARVDEVLLSLAGVYARLPGVIVPSRRDRRRAGADPVRRHPPTAFTAHLTVYVPVTFPPDVLEHHLRHYAVEFRNWIAAAGAARS